MSRKVRSHANEPYCPADDDLLFAKKCFACQKAIHGQCFGDQSGEPAWKTKPSWYQISNNDNMIPPETQKEMAERINPKKIIHLDSGHLSLATHPKEITNLILEAAATL